MTSVQSWALFCESTIDLESSARSIKSSNPHIPLTINDFLLELAKTLSAEQ